jgi:uncharacterized membrane protein
MSATQSPNRFLVTVLFVVCAVFVAAWSPGASVIVLLAAVAAWFLMRRPVDAREGDLDFRVEFLEGRVQELQEAVSELRVPEPAPTPAPRPAAPPAPPPRAAAEPPPPAPQPAPPAPRPAPAASARSFDWGRTLSTADLMGAKALAIAGGVVTLLGVVFFFVLAVNRGWIGPGTRVACGAVASGALLLTGLWLHRRYETTYASLAAVGAGIAGFYATLLAATSLYDMVSKPVALVLAGAIASVAVTVSLAWSAELVAGFGLLGAMLVPATLVFQGGLRPIGTAFVAFVFAGTAIVCVRERWWTLLRAGIFVSAVQAAAQVADIRAPHVGIVVLAGSFWLLYVATGLAWQFRSGRELAGGPASLVVGSAVFAGVAAALLFDRGLDLGITLLVVAASYVGLAGALYVRRRETATLFWAVGLAVGAVGVAEALSGSTVTYAWAAEAALLAWLAGRLRDPRLQLPSLVYLCLAAAHALAFEAHPDHFLFSQSHPAGGAPALIAIAAAALLFARFTHGTMDARNDEGVLRHLRPLLSMLDARRRRVQFALFVVCAALSAYAASLGILELFQAAAFGTDREDAFEWGHVAVTSAWSVAGVAAVLLALRRRSPGAYHVAIVWLALTAAKTVSFDTLSLGRTRFSIGFLVVAGALLAAGLARQRLQRQFDETALAVIVAALGLALTGATILAHGHWGPVDADGAVVLAIGLLYATLGALAYEVAAHRNLATLLTGLGLAVVAIADPLLLAPHVWLVLAYAASAAALAGTAAWLAEDRLNVASTTYFLLGAAVALAFEAPPTDLVQASAHPASGVPSLLLVAAAGTALAATVRNTWRVWIGGGSGAVFVYAASLAILEAVQRISPEDVHTDFQRGHTAVSAFWGVLALVSLYVGLRRHARVLRLGGFILFAISLGKIFLYDLPSLSSAQRAISFLAVGAVLLFGGFFYQRLSAQLEERDVA